MNARGNVDAIIYSSENKLTGFVLPQQNVTFSRYSLLNALKKIKEILIINVM